MSAIDDLAAAAARYAAGFDKGDLPAPPARRVAVVTCMDARILTSRLLGLEEGDAHVIRNAGGRVQDALRSLVVSQRLLGTNEVMVIHHSGCGMRGLTDDAVRSAVREDLGADDGGLAYLGFDDVEQSVRDDVAFLRDSPLIDPGAVIRGFVYDEKTGRLTDVA
ncbi:MAG TPA: carbonic anhydrase [Solirubrobacteraceae bacterium]|nr:carbonic anhydrase [Solirubrobacteraceae bacterium]